MEMIDESYELISVLYEGKFAERSQVPYINHIDEGLVILNAINASDYAKAAYCLHPVVQSEWNIDL